MKKEIKIGDKVWVDGFTSMAQGNFHESKVDKIEFRYDEMTGEKYTICEVSGAWYDARTGLAYSKKKENESVYYIEFDK